MCKPFSNVFSNRFIRNRKLFLDKRHEIGTEPLIEGCEIEVSIIGLSVNRIRNIRISLVKIKDIGVPVDRQLSDYLKLTRVKKVLDPQRSLVGFERFMNFVYLFQGRNFVIRNILRPP